MNLDTVVWQSDSKLIGKPVIFAMKNMVPKQQRKIYKRKL